MGTDLRRLVTSVLASYPDVEPRGEQLAVEDIADDLTSAHAVLARLPVEHWPASHRPLFADVQNEVRVHEDRRLSLRAPTVAEIAEARRTLALLDLLPEPPNRMREVVTLRSFAAPSTLRPLFSWTRVALRTRLDFDGAQAVFEGALATIARHLNASREVA